MTKTNRPICNRCGKVIDKKYGWHISEDLEKGNTTFYHWNCLGDYGERVKAVVKRVKEINKRHK